MRLLAIETATDVCSVAVLDGGALRSEVMTSRPRSHAEFLVPMIEQALRFAALSASELDAVAVSMGPGSYTGLRIGVSTAKGVAFASGASIVGVPSLEAMAHGAAVEARVGEYILTAFGARRNEAYVALWEVMSPPETGEAAETATPALLQRISADAAVSVERIAEHLPPKVSVLHLADAGTTDLARILAASRGEVGLHAERFQAEVRHSAAIPAARHVAILGEARLKAEGPEDLVRFEPFYLKEFVAKTQRKSIFERLPF